MKLLNGLFLLARDAFEAVYRPEAAAAIANRVNLVAPAMTAADIKGRPELLADVDVIFSGWGMPKVDEAFLDAAPNLKAIFYAAGAIGGWAGPAVWDRGLVVTTASHANAIPVAEYTVATTLFSLKHGWRLACDRDGHRGFQIRSDVPGNYGSVVGLIGMGTIGRLVVRMFEPFGVRVLTHDPYLSADDAERLDVQNVGLGQLFAECDVVSLHAPDVPQTRGMITGELIASMKPGATLINTSRGRLIREEEMIRVLRQRPDLQAVLDVTEQEPLPFESPLNRLPNVVLTPHIAGSQGRECQRMGQYMVDELDRYLHHRPLRWQLRPAAAAGRTVHQCAASV